MDTATKFGMGGTLLIITLIVAGITGYVKNIVALTDCDFEAPVKCEVIHTIGLLPIVGVFTGYMDFGK